MHDRLKKLMQQRQADSVKFQQEIGRQRLLKSIRKKLTTSFIGALVKMEEHFGFLWGHNKDDPTEEEEEFYKLWEDCRTAILDNGNEQLRALEAEFEGYNVTPLSTNQEQE